MKLREFINLTEVGEDSAVMDYDLDISEGAFEDPLDVIVDHRRGKIYIV